MPVADEQVTALRTILTGDAARYKELYAKLDRSRLGREYTALVAAAFGTAVMRRFGEQHTTRDVVEFVADARSRSENIAAKIDPEVGERLIGAVLGEATTQGISREAVANAQFLLLGALVAAEHLDDAGLDAFMEDARKLADEMLAG